MKPSNWWQGCIYILCTLTEVHLKPHQRGNRHFMACTTKRDVCTCTGIGHWISYHPLPPPSSLPASIPSLPLPPPSPSLLSPCLHPFPPPPCLPLNTHVGEKPTTEAIAMVYGQGVKFTTYTLVWEFLLIISVEPDFMMQMKNTNTVAIRSSKYARAFWPFLCIGPLSELWGVQSNGNTFT